MIDIATEQIRPLVRAAADIPGRPHISTLVRWASKGIKGVRLETLVIGGRRYTSAEAVQRFVTRLNSAPRDRAPGAPGRDAGRVDRLLDQAGI